MTYGQDSADASYEDFEGGSKYFGSDSSEQAAPQEPQQPTFDPSKFVPVEQFNQVQQEVSGLKPIVEGMRNVFAPQVPQLTPEQKATQDWIAKQAETALNPQIEAIKKQNQVLIDTHLDSNAQAMGFEDKDEQYDWFWATSRGLGKAAQKGDQQAAQMVRTMAQLHDSGDMVSLQSFAKQNFQYLDNFAGRLKVGANVRPQIIGHSFSNNAFTQGQNQPSLEQLQAQANEYRFKDPAKYTEVMNQMKKLALSNTTF